MSESCWIETATGRKVHPLTPRADEICIEDIAHALANQCRFSGHTKYHYSVAQHSVYVSRLVPPEHALWGLLHDASEAYLIDLPRPIKHQSAFGDAFTAIEKGIEAAVAEAFGLALPMPAAVKQADSAMLLAEKRDLMPNVQEWSAHFNHWGIEVSDMVRGVTITPMLPAEAKRAFLARYNEILCARFSFSVKRAA